MRYKTLALLVATGVGLAAVAVAQKTAAPNAAAPARAAQAPAAQAPAKSNPPAAAEPGPSPEQQAILKIVAAFEKAFNAHDAKAIAAMYLPEAEIVDSEGNVYQGREEIEAVFADIFADSPQCSMQTVVNSIRLVSPTLAFEDGTAVVTHDPDEPAERTGYTVVHVKQEGQWLMASARDLPDELGSSEEQLKQLAWLIGDWIDESPDALVHTSYRWSDNESFIVGEFTAQIRGQLVMSGTNRIGWDPLLKKIRSWVFDSEGGFAEGIWTRSDNQWVAKMSGVTRDGKASSATNVLTYLGKDRATFQSRDRVRGAEVTDDIDEVIMVRKPPKPM